MDRFKDRRGNRRTGLGLLLAATGSDADVNRYTSRWQPTDGHPFGFDLPKDMTYGGVVLFASPGSDASVRHMASWVKFFCKGSTHMVGGVDRLRFFTVRPHDEMSERRYFAEVWVGNMVAIGGDLTYFSGGGGASMQDMRSLFLALSAIYELDIEE